MADKISAPAEEPARLPVTQARPAEVVQKPLPDAPQTVSENKADEQGRRMYDVQPGVEWLNGQRLDGAKQVRLTKEEAQYDVEQGRAVLTGGKHPSHWREKKAG